MRVISAPDSVVGTAIATWLPPEAAASAFAVSITRPPPSADDALARDGAEQVAGQLVDAAGGNDVHRSGALHDRGRHRRGPLGREQRVALAAERLDRLGGRARAEADRALAVPPGEAARHQIPLISRTSHAARNGSTIRTLPWSRATSSSRSSASTARWIVEGAGRLWRRR